MSRKFAIEQNKTASTLSLCNVLKKSGESTEFNMTLIRDEDKEAKINGFTVSIFYIIFAFKSTKNSVLLVPLVMSVNLNLKNIKAQIFLDFALIYIV